MIFEVDRVLVKDAYYPGLRFHEIRSNGIQQGVLKVLAHRFIPKLLNHSLRFWIAKINVQDFAGWAREESDRALSGLRRTHYVTMIENCYVKFEKK
jgi:hypothetical protein